MTAFFLYFFSALPKPAWARKALGLNDALDGGGRGEVATVSVPGQAGAQHSLSPIKAEDGAMMLTNGPVAQKFPQSWLTGTGINADIGLRLRGIVTRCFVYFV
jgi:hypothetical protein